MKDVTNFRDIGGLETSDGRRIRHGMLLRAAAPVYAEREQVERMAALGIRTILDFRSDGERIGEPSAWVDALGIRYVAPNAGRSVGDPLSALMKATVDGATTRALMHEVYRSIPVDQAPAFRILFGLLVAGDAPVLYHCASGKDRTGIFTALLLTLLGVPREAIVADFVRSNDAIEAIAGDFRQQPRLEPVWSSPWEAWGVLTESDPAWLATMFAALEQRHGSVEAYCTEVLGIGEPEREALRAQLLEACP